MSQKELQQLAKPEISANINFGGLKKLVQEMSKNYSVKVGLLAENGGSDEVSENLDIAGLGAVQEFGARIKVTDKMRGFLAYKLGIHLKKETKEIVIPARSWLQMPLERPDLKKKIVEKTQLTKSERELAELAIIEYGDYGILGELAYAVGTSALEEIQEAFDTEGFGEWIPNSPATIRAKGSDMPLIDEGKLRSKVNFKVEET